MNLNQNKTYIALLNKANGNGRMPSIKSIHSLLESLGINHWYYESVNVVEYRTGQNTYVNSRHEGKTGYEIRFRATVKNGEKSPFFGGFNRDSVDQKWVCLDTSDSYYSWNSGRYAEDLINVLNNYTKLTFSTR